MRYTSKEAAQKDHVDNYKSDGISKRKGTRYASDYNRVCFVASSVPNNATVLDVGCNGGTIGVHLLKKSCHVKGIDIVPELVEKAKRRGIFAETGEAEDLSRYADNSFDAVICAEVLEHLFDPVPAISEAYRVLKPGGVYVVTVPHPDGDMCANDKLGDYHQQNFSFEILDTLFHMKFERGNVFVENIGYIPEYCIANGKSQKDPQWVGIVAKKTSK